MRDCTAFFINGLWEKSPVENPLDIINPATEECSGRINMGTAADIHKAVLAARAAFPAWSEATLDERADILRAVLAGYQNRQNELVEAIIEEMGAPLYLAQKAQVPIGAMHLAMAIENLTTFPFEELRGTTLIRREAIGVCAMITPWNWPLNQIVQKVAPSLAVGCTIVMKPSEISPYSAHIFTEILDEAGLPAGVFNLVHGDGLVAGAALAAHPEVDMVSFTGSTRAGVEVARAAAPTVKRVAQELGGKSPNIILDDAALVENVTQGVKSMMGNTGQTCVAPSRMLVPNGRMEEVILAAQDAAATITVGNPKEDVRMGPLSSAAQFSKVTGFIRKGIAEGAQLIAGGPERPEGLDTGYYVRPTVFAGVTNDMEIAQEEIFGPVLCILGYEDLDEAVQIANDTPYGLAAYVSGLDIEVAHGLARQLKAGQVTINGASDRAAPFGGFKRSGNGREGGEWGFHDFLEVKAILGHG